MNVSKSPAIEAATAVRCCWVCGSTELTRARNSTLPETITSDTFRITNSDYGRAAAIDRCETCGFHQCTDMVDVLHFYEEMTDPDYEATREQRSLQERGVLNRLSIKPPFSGRRLLDVGAGSGILVEEAHAMGFDAVGIEPSRNLQAKAAELGLPVYHGVLPHPEVQGPFDVITLIDVIEHVPNPVEILESVTELLAPHGIFVVVTPDRKSVAARIMQSKWWHYRVAHIGYFDPATLARALREAGMTETALRRPSWYFPGDYLFRRVVSYLPKSLQFEPPRFLSRIVIPLNLRDSLELEAVRKS